MPCFSKIIRRLIVFNIMNNFYAIIKGIINLQYHCSRYHGSHFRKLLPDLFDLNVTHLRFIVLIEAIVAELGILGISCNQAL